MPGHISFRRWRTLDEDSVLRRRVVHLDDVGHREARLLEGNPGGADRLSLHAGDRDAARPEADPDAHVAMGFQGPSGGRLLGDDVIGRNVRVVAATLDLDSKPSLSCERRGVFGRADPRTERNAPPKRSG